MPKFEERPEGAAPLFDSNSGQQAALKRWEAQRERNKLIVVEKVAARMGLEPEELTYEEALGEVAFGPLVSAAIVEGKVAAVKLLLQLLDEMPENADAKFVVDNRQVNFQQFRLTPAGARAYIEDQRMQGNNRLADIVESSIDFEANEEEIQVVSIPVE